MDLSHKKQTIDETMTNEKNQTSDIELVLHITGFNVSAYEQLYERYSPIIYTLIKRIVSDPALAQSVLIKVFAVFLKRLEFYDTKNDSVFTWLTLLARNIALDVLRRSKSEKDLPAYDDKYEIDIILPKLSTVISPINLNESSEKIRTYKNYLTEVQSLVLSIVYFEGLNEEEIAQKLNAPVATVKHKIQSTMESLMGLYREHEKFSGLRKEMLDLIKLDVLGCLTGDELKYFNKLKQGNPDFLWKELGDYQNLMALVSTSLPIEKPPIELSNKIDLVFGNVLQGKTDGYEISVQPKQVQKPEIKKENPPAENIQKQKQDFSFKFKEPPPNELFILKKQDPAYRSKEFTPSVAEDVNNVKIIDRNNVTNNRNNFTEKKEAVMAGKEIPQVNLKEDKITKQNTVQPVLDKHNIKVKSDEPITVIKETPTVPKPVEKAVQSRSIQPTSDRFNVKPKVEETSTVKKDVPIESKKEDKPIQAKTILPNSDRFNLKPKTSEPVTVKKEIPQAPVNNEKVIPVRTIQPTSDRFNLKPKVNEHIAVQKEIHSVSKNNEKDLQEKSLKPSVDNTKPNLKTSTSTATEKIAQTITNKANKPELAEKAEIKETKTNEQINVDEIVSRIDDGDTKVELTNQSDEQVDEVLILKKKLKRNYYLFAGAMILLLSIGLFVFITFSNGQKNISAEISNSSKSDIAATDNLNQSQNPQVAAVTGDIKIETQKIDPVQKQPEQINTSQQKVDSQNQVAAVVGELPGNTQTNETTVPVKENKIVIEEKPLVTAPLNKRQKENEEAPSTVLMAAEVQPELIGGLKGIQSRIEYPELANKLGIEGKVFVQAVVDESGKVISVKTIKGIGGGCDEVAMDAVKDSKFIPGRQSGKPVKVQVTIPIVFKH